MVPLREAELDSLMSRLARGDRSAFEPLYLALRPRALRLAHLRVGRSEAPDIAQAALLNVFARASEFAVGKPCLPWFYAIVANEVQRSRRRAARIEFDDAAGADATTEDDAEAQLLRRELERALDQAVDALDRDAAEAIAAVLGRGAAPLVSAPTFRKRVSRAYLKLRWLLGDHDAG